MQPEDMRAMLERQKRAHLADMTPEAAQRMDRLDRLAAMTGDNVEAVCAAISADFGNRAKQETLLADIYTVQSGVAHARRHVRSWMKPRRVATALTMRPGHNRLLPQPLGVVGVVSPWNYPYDLAIGPTLAAFAAGNRVMLKPSEVTPRTSELIARLAEKYFRPEELFVVLGDAKTGQAFTELPFDHLIFTGSTPVGRLVAQAAAKNLTPATLELGGKSPAILDASADMGRATASILHGKCFNAGQTCIAPDYVLAPREKVDGFVEAARGAVTRMYPTLANNADYTSIVSDRHYARLQGLLRDAEEKGAKTVALNPAGENFDPSSRKIPPTLVLDATPDMKIMQEEIFGPLLPVIATQGLDEAIAFVNGRDRPLALYWFGENGANRDRVLANTISGGVTINDTLMHFAQEEQPFGGVGPSGMGAYHGHWGFETFSKLKPVFVQSRFTGAGMLRPPYGATFDRLLSMLKRLS